MELWPQQFGCPEEDASAPGGVRAGQTTTEGSGARIGAIWEAPVTRGQEAFNTQSLLPCRRAVYINLGIQQYGARDGLAPV
mmetsp:Transcript_61577/g.144317  ORF Transcript_61577/g.144317 Transcript_61577/m.144317 type:complete len:81 (-) Transcript_61577:54-296(-)